MAPVSISKSISLFLTVNCTKGSCGEIVIVWEMSRGAPGPLHSSPHSSFLSRTSWWGFLSFFIFLFEFQIYLSPMGFLLAIGTLIGTWRVFPFPFRSCLFFWFPALFLRKPQPVLTSLFPRHGKFQVSKAISPAGRESFPVPHLNVGAAFWYLGHFSQ